jgi:hypothetical protein
MRILGVTASSFELYGAFESIATTTLSTNTATITFSSISATYQHLQIRILGRCTRGATSGNIRMQINSDTGTNYSFHELYGTGSAVSATGSASATQTDIGRAPGTTITDTNIFGVVITDIQDYASTTKNKTVRSFYGYDSNSTNGEVGFRSGVWLSTSAITSISLFPASSTNWVSGTTIALYGIKGA